MNDSDHDPLQPHAHEPNPHPPSRNADFELVLPDGRIHPISLQLLNEFPLVHASNCFIVSTGHGTSGPYTFSGVRLLDLIKSYTSDDWSHVEVIGGDGFGNRIFANEFSKSASPKPILLATRMDGQSMSRPMGLVRLIVPNETDDALRQVKWVARINVRH